jgi:hypothetical protein
LKLVSSTTGDLKPRLSMIDAFTAVVAVAVQASIAAPGKSSRKLERARYAGL